MNRYFITGTDTGCGKTYVSCRLLDFFNSSGSKAQALKPLASGGFWQNGQLLNEDVQALQQHNAKPEMNISGWSYDLPIAPHLAANHYGDKISAQAIADFCYQDTFCQFDQLLIEGAGGLMVPLNNDETWLDFLKIRPIPVILIVAMRLGCINHALLTASVLKAEGIECLGWVANILDPDMLFLSENMAYLKAKMPMSLMATFPYNRLKG